MATNIGQWELVVKGTKKKNSSVINGKLSKKEKKQFSENAPKVGKFIPPGATDPYNKSEDKENRQPKPPPTNQPPVTKKKDDGPKQANNIGEAIGSLTSTSLMNLIDMASARFRNSPLIWLEDLVSYLNVQINPKTPANPPFHNKLTENLKPEVKKLIFTTFGSCSDSVLAEFHFVCVTTMVQETLKGLNVYGAQLFLQLLAEYRPAVCVVHLKEYVKLQQHHQNHSPTILSLLWAVGEAGKQDFSLAIKVWFDLMFPLIGFKNYSVFVIDYGIDMYGNRDSTTDYPDGIEVRAFFSIFDLAWSSSHPFNQHNKITPVSHRRIRDHLYPKFEEIALCNKKELNLLLPSFLRRLDSSENDVVLSCLIQCLTYDLQCWKVLEQLYLKHIPQSAILLDSLHSHLKVEEKSPLIWKKEVKKTIEKLVDINDKMAHKVHAVQGLKQSTKAAKDLNQYIEEKNKSSGLFRWNRILFILTILVIGWDIKRHKSFQASTIGRTIDNLGLTLYFETLGRSFRKGLLQAIRWSEENLPVYYSKGCELVGPYLILFQEKSIVALQYIYELLVTLSNNAAQYIPIVSKKIEEVFPGYPQIMEDFSNKCLQVSVQGWKVVCENVGPIIIQIQEYFSTKIFVGPLEPTILYSHLINGSNYMLESSVKLYTSFVKILQD